MNPISSKLLSQVLLATAAAGLCAGEEATPPTSSPAQPPAAAPEPPASKPWWEGKIPDAIAHGHLLLNARLRYEYADQSNLDRSDAFTLRTRLGYETAPLYGFRGLLEFENVTILGNEDNYNQAGLNPKASDKTVIADPEGTELNRAWIGYERFDTVVKYGRQRILLDDQRFVGNVGWRQNEQTFDGVTVQNQSLPDTTLFYSYIHNVNRVYGDEHPLGDFDSNSHLIHAAYAGCPYATLTGYAYLLDFDNAPANSSASFGANLDGGYTVDADANAKLNYHAEYAFQTEYGNQPNDYDAHYYRIQLGGEYDRFNAGAGYEVLGSDRGKGFSTPLATLHSFNGWDDVFLTTPNAGLEDAFVWAGVKLPGTVPVKAYYHEFRSNRGDKDFGHEVDVVASRKFGSHWTALVKYAFYDGKEDFSSSPAYDVHKAWAQVEFNF
jgi:Alginate export